MNGFVTVAKSSIRPQFGRRLGQARHGPFPTVRRLMHGGALEHEWRRRIRIRLTMWVSSSAARRSAVFV